MSKKSNKLSDAVLKDLMNKIEDNTYPPGTQLPNEIELAEIMGVSRTTIREAENHLVSMNILSKTRGRGTFVLNKEERLEEDKEFDNLNYMKTRLGDLYDLRMLIEPSIAALAALKATDEDIERIIQINEKIVNGKATYKNIVRYNHQFHEAISYATHNELIIKTFRKINDAIADNFNIQNQEHIDNDDMIRSHNMITMFLKLRDQIGAKKAMELHLSYSVKDFSIGKSPLK